MLKLVLLVGIACVGFTPIWSGTHTQGGWEKIQPSPALMVELKKVLADGHPDVIPVEILNVNRQEVAGTNYDVTFQSLEKKVCEVAWTLKLDGQNTNIIFYGCEWDYDLLRLKRGKHGS